MQIVIPMSGFGERFRRVGYKVPKPLIEIDGKPIIAHVIELFPDETDFTFICNEEHLNEPMFNMEAAIKQFCPIGKIIGIKPHRLGPVNAIIEAQKYLDMKKPTVVNYCDFTCYWNWRHFKYFIEKIDCFGAVPAYHNFHPHSLGSTNYAYIKEADGWMTDIKEKESFTNNRMQEFASSGTYYFKTAQLMIEAFEATVSNGWSVAGEFYVSLAYKWLLMQKKPIAIYPLQHFMQWGTPEDVAEYKKWSDMFKRILKPRIESKKKTNINIIPMAGFGQRFSDEGFSLAKPMIPVSGKPMFVQATNDLPAAQKNLFILRSDMPNLDDTRNEIKAHFPKSIIKILDGATNGQADTVYKGIKLLFEAKADLSGITTIAACDNGALYDETALNKLLADTAVDVIVWGVRGHIHAIRNPNMYGWINCSGNDIQSVSVKSPLNDPSTDPIITGTFTFKQISNFNEAFHRLERRSEKINDEFYIDSLINDAIDMGLNCKLFEIDHYLCWGTPDDLRSFEYWQSCFDKWHGHPYRLDLDTRISKLELKALTSRYEHVTPQLI